MSRQAMCPAERDLRSRLSKLFFETPLLRGSLGVRKITCGDASCRCARGQTHDTLYLSYMRDGRNHQVSIPHDLEPWVRQCVRNHREMLELVDQLCEVSQEVIRARKARRG